MGIGLILALGAALAYGASDFIGGLGSRRHSPWRMVVVGQSAGALAALVAGLFAPGHPKAADFGWAALAGLGTAVGTVSLYRGLSRGRMGMVAPVSAVGAAILPVLVGLVLGERPSWLAWLGVIVALPGIWLVAREKTEQQPNSSGAVVDRVVADRVVVDRAVVDGAIAGAGFGVLFIALGQVSHDAGLLPLAANQAIGAVLTIAAAAVTRKPWLPRRGVLGWGSASGLLGTFATLGFMLAAAAIHLGIAAVLTSLYPAFTVILAAAILKERLGAAQRIGLVICMAAVGALALG